MTSPLDLELTSFVAGTKAADSEDAPLLLAVVRRLRQDDDLSYESTATALEAMAKRMAARFKQAERFEERGLLDETASLATVDFAEPDEFDTGNENPG